jgi:hypothetical protein
MLGHAAHIQWQPSSQKNGYTIWNRNIMIEETTWLVLTSSPTQLSFLHFPDVLHITLKKATNRNILLMLPIELRQYFYAYPKLLPASVVAKVAIRIAAQI